MTIDPSYQAQLYHHFSLEAPDLLSQIEQALLNLQEEEGNLEQVRILMRATHTLKSIAATMGLETIKNIAHTLEDVFRSICQPDVVIDNEMKALFFQGYECLRDPLMAELTGCHLDDVRVMERSSLILSRLQSKLGNFLLKEPEFSSPEVSFESIQMLFEGSIGPELEKTVAATVNAKPKEIATILRKQAELFLGYAEAIGLPGFLAIAQATIAALDNHPQQARTIARFALEDFRQASAGILDGDNLQGGCPSPALQQLASLAFLPQPDLVPADSKTSDSSESIVHLEENDSVSENPQSDAARTPSSLLHPNLTDEVSLTDSSPSAGQPHRRESLSSGDDTPAIPVPKIVRVNVEHIENLNYLNAELLTNHNRQFLQDGKMRNSLRKLLGRLRQFQQMLGDLQNWSNPLAQHYRTQYSNTLSSVHTVDSRKFDNFDALELNSYNEFHVFIQSLLEEAAYLEQETDTLEQFNRQTTHLLKKQQKLLTNSRDVLLDARMLPLGRVLNRLHPVLEQLQTSHKKPISLTIKGNEVLVDKAIAERLYEPLLHLVRNAFDHGIESSEVRRQRGKLAQGQIEIRAYYRGSQLIIDVQDDGQGLDFDAIRQQGIQRELIAPEAASTLNESQLAELLFEPSFSTAKQVNELSGRGVGLDVVRVQLQSIQGTVALHTEPQKGTTFSLQIPLSLSINKLLVCQAGKKVYALAADTIDQILLPKPDQIQYSEHGRVLRLAKATASNQLEEGELIRIYRLSEILDCSSRQPTQITSDSQTSEGDTVLPLLVVPSQDHFLALEVDRIIWEQELVIRPFGKLVPTSAYIYGGTILADGRLTLVINGAALLQHILNKEMQSTSQLGKQAFPTVRVGLPSTPSFARPALSPKFENSKHTVMIVDDSITLRHALVFTLQKAGHKTLQARDGYEAIAQIQAVPGIDLIICDIEMPRMNGFEFLAHCKSNDYLCQIPILILSSRTALKHRQMALKLGATAYLTKPYSEQQLLATVTQILSTKGASIVYS